MKLKEICLVEESSERVRRDIAGVLEEYHPYLSKYCQEPSTILRIESNGMIVYMGRERELLYSPGANGDLSTKKDQEIFFRILGQNSNPIFIDPSNWDLVKTVKNFYKSSGYHVHHLIAL